MVLYGVDHHIGHNCAILTCSPAAKVLTCWFQGAIREQWVVLSGWSLCSLLPWRPCLRHASQASLLGSCLPWLFSQDFVQPLLEKSRNAQFCLFCPSYRVFGHNDKEGEDIIPESSLKDTDSTRNYICFQFENGPKAELLFSAEEYDGRLSKLRYKNWFFAKKNYRFLGMRIFFKK